MANSKYMSPADSTFYDMLDRVGLDRKGKTSNILRAAFLAGGMPYIKAHDSPITASFQKTKEKKEYPNPFGLIGEKSMMDRLIQSFIPRTEPDTLNISGKYSSGHVNPLDDYLAEISHAIQFNKPEPTRELLNMVAHEERRASGEDVYNIEGTMEHDAHSRYEPHLAKDFMKTVEKEYPGWTPILKEWEEESKKYPEAPDEEEKYGGYGSLLFKLIKKDSEKTFNSMMYNIWKTIGSEEKKEKWQKKYWGIKD
jgi:hypothetical protein